MNYRCGHCNAPLTIHRNIVLHPDEDGCEGAQESTNAYRNHDDYDVLLADAAEHYVRQIEPTANPDHIYDLARTWSLSSWAAVARRWPPSSDIKPTVDMVGRAVSILNRRIPF